MGKGVYRPYNLNSVPGTYMVERTDSASCPLTSICTWYQRSSPIPATKGKEKGNLSIAPKPVDPNGS